MSAPEDAATDVMPRVPPPPRPRRTIHPGMWTLVALAGILSVARLTMRGLESGAFDDASILGIPWVTPLLLAFLFALVTDVAIFEAIAIIVRNPRNWAAWAMLLLFASMTVYYQAHGPEPWMVMATAPVAMVLVVIARHLVPAIEDALRRREDAEAYRESRFEPPREVPAPHRESSPPVVVHNTIHTSAQAATLTTTPHREDTGEEHTGEAGEDVTTRTGETTAPAITATPHRPVSTVERIHAIRGGTPPRREIHAPSVPAFSSVEEAYEEIVVRRGEKLGWRKAMTLTGENEYTAKKELRRLAARQEVTTS